MLSVYSGLLCSAYCNKQNPPNLYFFPLTKQQWWFPDLDTIKICIFY